MKRLLPALYSRLHEFVKFFYDKKRMEARKNEWNNCIEEKKKFLQNEPLQFCSDSVPPIRGWRKLL
jgi:hypothetical protein